MSGFDAQNEIILLRERATRLETQLEELTRRVDSLQSYSRQLYDYLQKQRR
jgi:hypothetical protein